MSDDLVKRLWENGVDPDDADLMIEAADRIEKLEAALREIAEISDFRSTHPMSSEADYFRIARKALDAK